MKMLLDYVEVEETIPYIWTETRSICKVAVDIHTLPSIGDLIYLDDDGTKKQFQVIQEVPITPISSKILVRNPTIPRKHMSNR